MDENQIEGTSVETQTTTDGGMVNGQQPTETQETKVDEMVAEKMFNQAQVNEMIKNRLNKIYKRYGVADSRELDDLIAMAQSYKAMRDLYADMKVEHSQINEENLGLKRDMMFVNNNVNPNKYEEIISLFKGRGLDLNEENFRTELALHNDWLKPQPKMETFKLGVEQSGGEQPINEREQMAKMFGLKGFVR